MLAAVSLPGGVQRKRTYEDELQMREFFEEGDMISVRNMRFECLTSVIRLL